MPKARRKACSKDRVHPLQLWDMFCKKFNDGVSPYEFDCLGPKFQAELVSLTALFILLIGGCAQETPPPPPPSVTVTVEETNKESSIELLYSNHNNGWVKATFTTPEEAKAYREQLEFAVVKLKEAEEKMNASNTGDTADE